MPLLCFLQMVNIKMLLANPRAKHVQVVLTVLLVHQVVNILQQVVLQELMQVEKHANCCVFSLTGGQTGNVGKLKENQPPASESGLCAPSGGARRGTIPGHHKPARQWSPARGAGVGAAIGAKHAHSAGGAKR